VGAGYIPSGTVSSAATVVGIELTLMVLASRQFKRLQHRCEARLAALRMPSTVDIGELCEYLGQLRRRPIRLVPMPLHEARSCGVWLALPDADLIAYEENTSRMHQDHIVAHELSHLICGHSNTGASGESDTLQLFPDLDPAMVRALLQRSHYSTDQEREAEVMASLLLRTLSRPPAGHGGHTDLTSRLEQALIPPRQGRRTGA